MGVRGAVRAGLGGEVTVARRRHYHPIQRDYVTFLETSAETGGARTLIEVELAPGGGNPPHYHLAYDEHFEVVRGTLGVVVEGRALTLGPGDTATAPLNTRHNFHNPTAEPTVFLVTLTPGSTGFERSLQIGYGLARDGLASARGIPRDLAHLALLLEMGDMRMPGALALLGPLLRFLARRARRRGLDRQLVARYCD